jgi:predicted ArsR family transcriptional regulator
MKTPIRYREIYLEIAKDEKPRTAQEIADLLEIKLTPGATRFLRALVHELTLERSEWRLKRYPPVQGSRAILWRLEMRKPACK